MKLFIAADHAGFELKEKIKRALAKKKYPVHDLSPHFVKDDDYPEHGFAVADAVRRDTAARGILVCESGVGMAMAANRRDGARAFVAHDTVEVRHAREDNDANILALNGGAGSLKKALVLIETFLKTPASKATRHRRRVKQLG